MVDPDKVYHGRVCGKDPGHGTLRRKINGCCVECGRIRSREGMRSYREDPEKVDKQRLWREENRPRLAWLYARRRALEQGVPFEITVEDIPPVPQFCPVLGIPLEFGNGGSRSPKPTSPSLDRIIPGLGYVVGNIHWISQRANTIKNNATVEELQLVAEYFSALQEGARVGATP